MLSALQAQQYTRGVGVYPGDPKEDFAAQVVPDTSQAYRNLALHRAAYQSSSYDFNLTAQLATDGVKETKAPRWFVISTNEGLLTRQLREHAQDHNLTTNNQLNGSHAWMQFEFGGGDGPPELDRVETSGMNVTASADQPAGWTMVVRGSDDGQTWTELGRTASADRLPAGRGFGVFGAGPGGPGAAPGAAGAGAAGGGRGVAGGGRGPGAPGAVVTPGAPAVAGPGGPGGGFGGRGGGPAFTPSVGFTSPARKRFIRVEFDAPAATRWSVAEMILKDKGDRVDAGGPYQFSSAWKAATNGGEWLYVDLGAVSTFDRVTLSWLRRPADGVLQSSDDAKVWKTLRVLPASGDTDDLKLDKPERGRYVRLFLTKAATPDGYILTEMEVWGRGGVVPRPKPAPVATANGRLRLSAGAWRIQRDSLVKAGGAALSKAGFDDKDWLPATVPGTVVSTYFDDGAIPDPSYDNNMMMLSDSFFYADFWYRDEFVAPPVAAGQHIWLNFNGVNWKAEVFLNGERVGRIDGGFMRGRFDVTGKLLPGAKNALAVRLIKNATPGSVKEKTLESPDPNGGALGADNPTYHATAGWDWIPSVRGRDIGIWAGVYLEKTGPVTIEAPYVSTTLPNANRADVSVEATLHNVTQQPVSGTFRGRFGTVAFETPVTVEAGASKAVKLDPSTTPALRLQNPKLWWPAGYGDQNLYDVQLSFVANGTASDTKSFKSGVKQYTYADDNSALKIYINGRRLIGRGGNWGFPEELLRFRSREYDWAVRYHKDMNFTMIRNWVGQTGDDEFYDACDKYGIVVWQDFWLANPVDGPNPDDNDMFLKNANDYILKIRNHPSIGLWVGRNEGNPPQPIEDGLIQLTQSLQPGSHYIPSSAGGTVSGGGPYRTQAPKVYFQTRATTKLHSELGMPNVLTLDSVKQMMRADNLWPMNDVWGEHDFTLTGAQGASTWLDMIDKNYGGAKNVEDFVELSQFIDYDGYRAMFEAQGKNRMGLLLWMSHSCWPSFVWETYDYYFDQSGAYFGSKKANEPLHIQWNPITDDVEVVNYSAGNVAGLTANIEILNMDGSKKWEKSATLDSKEDSVETPIKIEYPSGLTPVHFLRLKLRRGAEVVSENFYLRGLEETQPSATGGRGGGGFGGAPATLGYNLTAIRQLPKVKVEASTTTEQKGGRWFLTTELHNASSAPALMVRVKAVRSTSGDRILPAIYSDNYVALMPGEKRTIKTELENADTRGERPRVIIEGFNVEKPAAKVAAKPASAE
jgi:hypothetical protein